MPHSLLLISLFSLIFRYFHLRRYLCLYHSSWFVHIDGSRYCLVLDLLLFWVNNSYFARCIFPILSIHYSLGWYLFALLLRDPFHSSLIVFKFIDYIVYTIYGNALVNNLSMDLRSILKKVSLHLLFDMHDRYSFWSW